MKKEDWKRVEEMVSAGMTARLRIETHIITLQLERIKMRLVVAVYVDGAVQGAWLLKEGEHNESRFMYRMQRYVYNAKSRKMWAETERKLSKRELRSLRDGMFTDINAKRTRLVPWFPSVTKVRTQYEKTFKSIELVTE